MADDRLVVFAAGGDDMPVLGSLENISPVLARSGTVAGLSTLLGAMRFVWPPPQDPG
ncbi:hypothetical protein [Streptomyces sp. NPDC048521]|uniref:hypothetical protein n=1 Tax=Streptomyces sp. NPDC048521 TaxID=3365566 RepID=UPI00371AC005